MGNQLTIEYIESFVKEKEFFNIDDILLKKVIDILILSNKVNLKDVKSNTILLRVIYETVESENKLPIEYIRRLIDAGIDINDLSKNPYGGYTPLLHLIESVLDEENIQIHIDVARMLLNKGAKLTQINDRGNSTLDILLAKVSRENQQKNENIRRLLQFYLDNIEQYVSNIDDIRWLIFKAYDELIGGIGGNRDPREDLDDVYRPLQETFRNAFEKYGITFEIADMKKYIDDYRAELQRQADEQGRDIDNDYEFVILENLEMNVEEENIEWESESGNSIYKEISDEIMKIPPAKIDISQTITHYDPIEMEETEIHIGNYLSEDRGNIVIVYDNNKYFFTTRVNINNQKKDATLYPCKTGLDEFRMRIDPQLVVSALPLYDLKKVGFLSGYPCIMNKLFGNPDAQLFSLVNLDLNYPSFVSQAFLNEEPDSAVSGLHCQAGQESKLSFLDIAIPFVSRESGKRKPEQAMEEFDRGEPETKRPMRSMEGGTRKKGKRKLSKTKKYIKKSKNKRRTRRTKH